MESFHGIDNKKYYIINGQSIFTVYRSLFVNGLLIFPLMTDVYFCYIN